MLKLLHSVKEQSLYPDEILIIDGSPDETTAVMLRENLFKDLSYHKVTPEHRGLTKQRNYGIAKVAATSEIVCFLDDDTVLEGNYFEEIINTYQLYPEALGVGGYITNEVNWTQVERNYAPKNHEFYYDGFKRNEGSRFVWRKKLGLDSNCPPGFLPAFSHGRSISFLPPSGKVYEVEQLMGGVSSFRKDVFDSLQFSTYFEGYGLYEDADFTLRLSKQGKLFVNTSARLGHFHAPSGRPNQYHYGKMVVRNGWYVWRVKYPNPSLKAQLKWHAITLLLTFIRMSNVFTKSDRKKALTETLGRLSGWGSLLFYKPQEQ
ncbi:glycosyl transferase [Flavobacterium limnosediminis JC2902]|uniref:Glycosyl transferase n=1 Tax=Flavobacterium limnosediminis JC2902 TaxID=1341181 RepID=V6SHL0_9FLAO|nr:glycosyl transferase [Flavobacterium limnosediminis JC2902]